MSVLKNNRGTSELEFYHTAIKLRKEITQNLLRDFGVKIGMQSDQRISRMMNCE